MVETETILKILLPVYESQWHPNFSDRILGEIRKAGMCYDLIMLVNSEHRVGELPARNKLFKMALQDDDWKYCVTLSNDVHHLPKNWGLNFSLQMEQQPSDVGALNAYGMIDTGENGTFRQQLIDKDGNNTGQWLYEDAPLPDDFDFSITPPNPELSTAFCIIKREVLERVGLFDEGFGMGGGMEHWDYVIRMYQNDFQNLLTYKTMFTTHIVKGNNFPPNDTTTYYRQKYGTHFDGIPTQEFVKRARTWVSKTV